jgi:hypothetical protein
VTKNVLDTQGNPPPGPANVAGTYYTALCALGEDVWASPCSGGLFFKFCFYFFFFFSVFIFSTLNNLGFQKVLKIKIK